MPASAAGARRREASPAPTGALSGCAEPSLTWAASAAQSQIACAYTGRFGARRVKPPAPTRAASAGAQSCCLQPAPPHLTRPSSRRAPHPPLPRRALHPRPHQLGLGGEIRRAPAGGEGGLSARLRAAEALGFTTAFVPPGTRAAAARRPRRGGGGGGGGEGEGEGAAGAPPGNAPVGEAAPPPRAPLRLIPVASVSEMLARAFPGLPQGRQPYRGVAAGRPPAALPAPPPPEPEPEWAAARLS